MELQDAEKKAILQKTGPCPNWLSRWRTREFALKGNFLYYYKTKVRLRRHIYRMCMTSLELVFLCDEVAFG